MRRQVLIKAFEQYFGARVTILGANAGIHVMARIDTALSDRIVIEKAAAIGIGLISAREYFINGSIKIAFTPKYHHRFI